MLRLFTKAIETYRFPLNQEAFQHLSEAFEESGEKKEEESIHVLSGGVWQW